MIKWVGYLKSLKQYLFILLISCFTFGLGCFASAGYTRQVGNYGFNPYSQGYDVNLSRAGNPLTQSLGYTKQLFVVFDTTSQYDDYRMFWFWHNGLPYVYVRKLYHYGGAYQESLKEGNITSYSVCDEIISIENSSIPGNCTNQSVGNSTTSIIGSFLSTLTNQDYYYFDGEGVYGPYFNFCISNHSVGKSFCFGGNMGSSLTNSLGLNGSITFDTIDSSILQNPPSSQGNGSSSNDFNVSVNSGSIDISCSKRNALKWYENKGYTERLCYGGLDSFGVNLSGVVPIYGSGLDVEEIWFNTAGYRVGGGTGAGLSYNNWFAYRRPLYYQYKDGDLTESPFKNVPTVILTYFGALDSYGHNFSSADIMEYCDLKLYTSVLDSDYLGKNITSVCSVSNLLGNRPWGLNSSFNSGGDNKVGLDTNNIGGKKTSSGSNNSNLTGNGFGGSNSSSFSGSSGYTDGSSFITDFFNLLDDKFNGINKSDFGLGVLPTYIILAFMGLILFRFLSH